MKALALTTAFALTTLGIAGMVRGSALADARVEGGGASVPASSAAVVEPSSAPAKRWVAAPETATFSSVEAVSTSAALDWTPDDESAGRVLEPGETVQVLPLEVWRASLVMSDANRYELLRSCWCESRWQTDLVGAAGEEGACQVLARFHGPVPSDLRGQFQQADRIATQYGMAPWTTRNGCREWN